MAQKENFALKRKDERVIIHFDYDCFYAAVFEREDPKLRQLPFAVQQKQIIVTCNYEARRRGLYKLQLVKEARQRCPEAIGPSTSTAALPTPAHEKLYLRLLLGSHVARFLRHQLEEHKSYTCTVGVSTTKLMSKLVGNLNKPKGQTTLVPPYEWSLDAGESNVTRFLDAHDIGKVPGIGFKIAQKIRQYVLDRPAAFHAGHVYGTTKEQVSVKDVRLCPGMEAEVLERLLVGPGTPKDLGTKIWGLINGIDSTEDSYIKLDVMTAVIRELTLLTCSLIKRMRLDLMVDAEDDTVLCDKVPSSEVLNTLKRWSAHPRILRLTTRPRPTRNPDGSRPRIFNRISKSCTMPSIIFSHKHNINSIAEKVVDGSLLPLFRQLHPEESGWDLSLVNLCAANMALAGTDSKDGAGRDISRMFRRQDDVLREWKFDNTDLALSRPRDLTKDASKMSEGQQPHDRDASSFQHGSEDIDRSTQDSRVIDDVWNSEADAADLSQACPVCGARMPSFAVAAHQRFHSLPD
ncbi:MAG: hypothetical protein Q9195_000691 [Heterodermia aff. obscurata]